MRGEITMRSYITKIIFIIKTFIHIQLNAYKCAIALDDTMRAMGLMHHPHKDSKDRDVMLMNTNVRRELIHHAMWNVLPKGKWRK
jgi:hypothetical protein